jgi:hypothetical protein
MTISRRERGVEMKVCAELPALWTRATSAMTAS